MNYEELNNKLKQLRIEDYIWIIYIGIIILSFYSNNLERDYYINKNLLSKEKYRDIIILIFTILIFVYIYFFKSAMDDLNNLRPWDSDKKKELVTLSFIASLLIAVSGFIFLYIAIKNDNLDVELAFN